MSEKKSFYITTTIPYVNAEPHIGFALELVQADAIARWQRLRGREVFFSTGTDEYGQKIFEASSREGKMVEDYVDHYAGKFLELRDALNLSTDNFIRTTSRRHIEAAREFWRLCQAKGDIYKKVYRGLYCVGCEKFLTEKDLMDGVCSLHPSKKPEMIEEENYFFRLEKYKKDLLQYLSGERVIIPEWRRTEAVSFARDGMEDFSISRSKSRVSWGIPIPGDETQVMYVWFGAFVNYISTLGWPNPHPGPLREGEGGNLFEKFWVQGETVQMAGKDMVKFQSVMWQGMLLSAGFPNTSTIIYHGFITGEGGIKMSKSLGNVVNPKEIVEEYGTDALRYFLLREISSFEDSPFTLERFKEAYNANLANGLGNLVSRIMKMAVEYKVSWKDYMGEGEIAENFHGYPGVWDEAYQKFDLKRVMDNLWERIRALDVYIQINEPYKKIKTDGVTAKKDVAYLLSHLLRISYELEPLLSATALAIRTHIKKNTMPVSPLFPRKN